MRREFWVSGWVKPAIEWFKYAGYRLLRNTGGINPNNQMPVGSIILWQGDAPIPDGWEIAHDIEAQHVRPLA